MVNPELKLAEAFVEQTDRHVFLTGKAGTGKTTFLHGIRQASAKRMIVTAPTGVAAINARGVTLHSFFQLPFGPWVPGREVLGDKRSHRFRNDKRRLVENLDLLVIDEISMVRADVLDGVDDTLRRLRRTDRPFGGVQLLMIGDLGQLAPIAKDDEWEILRQIYESPYFFSSQALRRSEWLTIELQHIYRQTDPRFIDLLNRVRDGRLDGPTLERLHTRYVPDFQPPAGEGWITLSTHNRRVDALNESRLTELKVKARTFQAETEGDFPPSSYPAPESLDLKVGAQVLFVRNDSSPQKLYYNGKIGKVTRIYRDKVVVRCAGDREDIEVEPVTWENLTYRLDEETGEIREHKTGSFVQLPLKLAWAITIHKSQGLTFERAVIDAGSAFAAGQVYVALSRCKTMEGMVLTSRIAPGSVRTDEFVRRFLGGEGDTRATRADEQALESARLEYQWRILRQLFGLKDLRSSVRKLVEILSANRAVLQVIGSGVSPEVTAKITAKIDEEIFLVSEKFLPRLDDYAAQGRLPTADSLVLERTRKGAEYFRGKIKEHLVPLKELRIETENQELALRVAQARDDVASQIALAMAAFKACQHGYQPERVVRAKADVHNAAGKGRSRGKSSKKKSQVKGATAKMSFEMFQLGLGVEEIARKRELRTSTIERHLTVFVESGQLAIGTLVAPKRQHAIEKAFDAMPEAQLSEIKASLGDEYSYGELKLVKAHRVFVETSPTGRGSSASVLH